MEEGEELIRKCADVDTNVYESLTTMETTKTGTSDTESGVLLEKEEAETGVKLENTEAGRPTDEKNEAETGPETGVKFEKIEAGRPTDEKNETETGAKLENIEAGTVVVQQLADPKTATGFLDKYEGAISLGFFVASIGRDLPRDLILRFGTTSRSSEDNGPQQWPSLDTRILLRVVLLVLLFVVYGLDVFLAMPLSRIKKRIAAAAAEPTAAARQRPTCWSTFWSTLHTMFEPCRVIYIIMTFYSMTMDVWHYYNSESTNSSAHWLYTTDL